MLMFKYFCDKCRQEIGNNEEAENDSVFYVAAGKETYHFCDRCFQQVHDCILAGINGEESTAAGDSAVKDRKALKSRRVTDEEKARIAELHAKGMSVGSIADTIKRSYGTVHRILFGCKTRKESGSDSAGTESEYEGRGIAAAARHAGEINVQEKTSHDTGESGDSKSGDTVTPENEAGIAPDMQHKVFMMVKKDGMSYASVAKTMNVPVKEVIAVVSRFA